MMLDALQLLAARGMRMPLIDRTSDRAAPGFIVLASAKRRADVISDLEAGR